MAIYDGLLQLTGTPGTVSSDTITTGVQVSTNVIDMGDTQDLGIGDNPAPKLSVTVTTAFSGGTSLQVAIQGSVDNSTFTTMASGPVLAEANLIVGTHVFDLDWPRIAGALVDKPGGGQALPRYIRLQYTSVGTHGAGAIFGGFNLDRHDHLDSYPSSHSTLFPAGT